MTNEIALKSNLPKNQIDPLNISDKDSSCHSFDEKTQRIAQSAIFPITSSSTERNTTFSNRVANICQLPTEVLEYIFSYFASKKDSTVIRTINREFKSVEDDLLENDWKKVKKFPPEGIVDLAGLMKRLEQKFPDKTHGFLFNQLKYEFAFFGASLPENRLPITISDFKELQAQAKHAYDHAFDTIWKKVKNCFPHLPSLSTTEEIKRILNDPGYSNILNLLRSLDLRDCDLKMLPEEIGRFTKLLELRLDDNQLQSLPENIGSLRELRELRINHNQLKSLPKSIGSLVWLEKLHLDDNRLQSLPDAIVSLTRLQELDLSNNSFPSFPKIIGLLTSLRELYFNNNQLQSFPEVIGLLTSLQCLDLSNNELQFLSESIGSLIELKYLFLNKNPLQSLPKSIGSLAGLQCMHLRDHSLMFIPDEILESKNFHIRNNKSWLSLYKNELRYRSNSKLAQLYQSIILRSDDVQIKKLFSSLDPIDKNLIFEMVWVCAESPKTEDTQWGEHHTFENMNRFYLSVRKAIATKLERLSLDQQNKVYENVYRLAKNRLTENREWGEVHALEHYPRLADAIDMLKNASSG